MWYCKEEKPQKVNKKLLKRVICNSNSNFRIVSVTVNCLTAFLCFSYQLDRGWYEGFGRFRQAIYKSLTMGALKLKVVFRF